MKRTLKGEKKRLALYETEEQLEWLQRKAHLSGFKPLSATVLSAEQLEFGREGKTVTLHPVTFEGRLLVTDPARLVAAIRQGIGSAKGFGMGLLSLAPAD